MFLFLASFFLSFLLSVFLSLLLFLFVVPFFPYANKTHKAQVYINSDIKFKNEHDKDAPEDREPNTSASWTGTTPRQFRWLRPWRALGCPGFETPCLNGNPTTKPKKNKHLRPIKVPEMSVPHFLSCSKVVTVSPHGW